MRPRRTTKLRYTTRFAAPPEEVFALCVSRSGFEAAMPPGVRVHSWPAPFREGAAMSFSLAGLPWEALIDAYEEGRSFTDLQTRGPFRYFRHTHLCEPENGGTRYSDHLEFSTGLGPAGDLAAATAIRIAFGPRLSTMRALLGG